MKRCPLLLPLSGEKRTRCARFERSVAAEVDEVGLEEIAVWLKRSKVEARGERAQGQQEIAVVDYDSDFGFRR
jgi:hypothetical protein